VDGHFSTTISLNPGTHTLTAYAEVLGVLSKESRPTVVVTVGDVKGPTVTAPPILCDGTQPECLAQPDATGADVAFASQVTVEEDDHSTKQLCAPGQTTPCVPACGSGVTASCFTCTPKSGSHFPLGATQVTCTALDNATPANVGSTTFIVNVRSKDGPKVSGSDLTAEAEGPAGAVVSYQVSANGFITDCSEPGSDAVRACSTWHQANQGLGFAATAVAVDPDSGLVYAGVADTNQVTTRRLFVSQTHGQTWDELPAPGNGFGDEGKFLVVGGGGIFLPGSPAARRVSRDSGATWQLALASTAIRGLVADPKDVLHQVAWSNVAGSPDSVFETKDGWVNYEAIGAGVPTTVLAAVIDHFTGRVYVSVFPAGGVANQTLIYRRVAGIFRLAEAPQFQNVSPKSIGVAPAREACITDT